MGMSTVDKMTHSGLEKDAKIPIVSLFSFNIQANGRIGEFHWYGKALFIQFWLTEICHENFIF